MEMHTSIPTLIKADICIGTGCMQTHYHRGQTPRTFCESEYFLVSFLHTFRILVGTVTHSAIRLE